MDHLRAAQAEKFSGEGGGTGGGGGGGGSFLAYSLFPVSDFFSRPLKKVTGFLTFC